MSENDQIKVFVVEDDPAYTKFLKYILSLNHDFDTEFFSNGKDCLAQLHKKPTVIFVCCDKCSSAATFAATR